MIFCYFVLFSVALFCFDGPGGGSGGFQVGSKSIPMNDFCLTYKKQL